VQFLPATQRPFVLPLTGRRRFGIHIVSRLFDDRRGAVGRPRWPFLAPVPSSSALAGGRSATGGVLQLVAPRDKTSAYLTFRSRPPPPPPSAISLVDRLISRRINLSTYYTLLYNSLLFVLTTMYLFVLTTMYLMSYDKTLLMPDTHLISEHVRKKSRQYGRELVC